MNGIGTKGVDDFVYQLENDGPDICIKRIPFATIDSLVVRKSSRCGVERRIDGQQRKSFGFPGLVTQRFKLRNQSDACLFTKRGEPPCSIPCNGLCSSPKFGVRLEGKVVVNLKNDYVDSLLR